MAIESFGHITDGCNPSISNNFHNDRTFGMILQHKSFNSLAFVVRQIGYMRTKKINVVAVFPLTASA